MPDLPPTPALAEIQRAEFSAHFARFLIGRAWIVPFFGAVAFALALFDPSGWRRALVIAVVAAVGALSWWEIRRFRRHGFTDESVAVNLGAGAVGQAVLIGATGGIGSPLLPVMLPIALLSGMFVEPRARRLQIVGLQAVLLWATAAIQLGDVVPDLTPAVFGGGPAVQNHVLLLTAAAVFSVVLAVAATVGRELRRMFDRMLLRAIAAREETLRAHADQARAMTALSGEIAHELKNPLATVKGLAGLLAKDLPAGKPAERLAVLRREVDRMGEVLEGFLNFSRPLVPLEREPADLGVLVREVAILHEGMARERGVGLVVRAGPAPSRSDPRKVKQILLNLLQNALDASPAGETVELEAAAVPGGARLRILDRGPGLSPELGERAFEPGVTTKATGSGLGLTIARGLARQHGGELSLRPRDGGGLEAEVFLPEAIQEEP
jgi:signal transduction histidine kinase